VSGNSGLWGGFWVSQLINEPKLVGVACLFLSFEKIVPHLLQSMFPVLVGSEANGLSLNGPLGDLKVIILLGNQKA